MSKRDSDDLIDWRGCEGVQFHLDKLGGRATVGDTRMDADGVLTNADSGYSAEEIQELFGVDPAITRKLLEFAAKRRMQDAA